MAGKFAASRFAIDLRTFCAPGLNKIKPGRPWAAFLFS